MSLAHVIYPQAGGVVPFGRSTEGSNAAPWTALLVLDARIAVAQDCVSALGSSRRGDEALRCLSVLGDLRFELEMLFSAIVAVEKETHGQLAASRAYAEAVCSWCTDVAGALRDLASADESRWRSVRERAARQSSGRVRGTILPLFAELEAPMRSAALRMQGDVVVLNWNLRG